MNSTQFLTADRLRGYPRLFLAVYASIGIAWWCLSHNLIDPSGKPLGFDFITFWGASWLAQHGQAASAYDPPALWAAQIVAVPGTPEPYLWHYPPPFLLVVYPLAWLSYVAALAVFMAVGFALYIATMRRMFPGAEWLIAAFPAVLLVALHGQATFLLVAIIAGAYMMLDRRPVAAGWLLGLLVCKPHLAPLFPLAMAVSGRWKTLGAMAASAACLVLASVLAFGLAPWRGFLADLPLARRVLEEGMLPWDTMPTMFAATPAGRGAGPGCLCRAGPGRYCGCRPGRSAVARCGRFPPQIRGTGDRQSAGLALCIRLRSDPAGDPHWIAGAMECRAVRALAGALAHRRGIHADPAAANRQGNGDPVDAGGTAGIVRQCRLPGPATSLPANSAGA
ncbi:MAG: glycosyltransferase family 87 protein [Rhodospirillales bacterium]